MDLIMSHKEIQMILWEFRWKQIDAGKNNELYKYMKTLGQDESHFELAKYIKTIKSENVLHHEL